MYQIISSMNNNVTLAQDVNGEEVVLNWKWYWI